MVVERGGQRVTFEPYPVLGKRGVFEGSEVRIEAADGQVLSRRSQPRAAFQDFRHRLWWDSLDLLYFFGALTMPFDRGPPSEPPAARCGST